ncbi:pyridoxamine 5'-phosphate oxidase family protein [Marinirhabdus gelatinilytica]|uniref:General stress protein 26 n=1 Tax=Marinirhabdus gelatinilytica TaxID=1703343 RepID=A0A370Q670_9FLAO|nr:pyridoxamine 5'-phosphate oxidase family protein [Marinirhabdus gelatinilytica]RDK83857.1 general stress protein 26 [Marinirhabdus gelatinilytica]
MSKENLYSQEAIDKIKEIATDVDFCMMATNLSVQPISAIPMSTKKVDDTGTIWFLSNKDSDHNTAIVKDENTQLLYSGTSSMKFLSVYGFSEIIYDRDIIKELYSSADNAWFDGEDDPNITAIKFTPQEAAYWSNDGNKLVTLFKLARAAVTGNDQEIGTSGKMHV